MGLAEVLVHLPGLLRLRRRIGAHFIDHPPDVFVGIDAPDFNLSLERTLRQRGITTLHWVSPSVWAWRRYRLAKIYRGENWNPNLRAPLSGPGLDVNEGDYLLAIDGVEDAFESLDVALADVPQYRGMELPGSAGDLERLVRELEDICGDGLPTSPGQTG